MQNQIREGRSPERAQFTGRRIKASSFHPIQLVFLLVLTSCPSFKVKKDSKIGIDQIKQSLQKVCLSNEGNGRIKVKKRKYLFSFESYNDLEAKKWSVALELPLHGEELLNLNWASALAGEASMDGEFYRRILYGLKEDENNKKLVKVFLLKTAQILQARQKILGSTGQFDCQQNEFDKYKSEGRGICQLKESDFNFWWKLNDKKLSIQMPIANKYQYQIAFSSESDNFYHQISAQLKRNKSKRELFAMSLFLDSCNP